MAVTAPVTAMVIPIGRMCMVVSAIPITAMGLMVGLAILCTAMEGSATRFTVMALAVITVAPTVGVGATVAMAGGEVVGVATAGTVAVSLTGVVMAGMGAVSLTGAATA